MQHQHNSKHPVNVQKVYQPFADEEAAGQKGYDYKAV